MNNSVINFSSSFNTCRRYIYIIYRLIFTIFLIKPRKSTFRTFRLISNRINSTFQRIFDSRCFYNQTKKSRSCYISNNDLERSIVIRGIFDRSRLKIPLKAKIKDIGSKVFRIFVLPLIKRVSISSRILFFFHHCFLIFLLII